MAGAGDRWYARAVFIDYSPPEPATGDAGVPAARLWRARDIAYGVVFAMLAIVAIVVLLAVVHLVVGLEGEQRDVARGRATIAIEQAIGGWVL